MAAVEAEETRPGRYLLLEGDRVLVEGRIPTPESGKVADNGTFIFNDSRSLSELSGIFRAFDIKGRPIILRTFKANLYNNGLSQDGHYAVCQTCNSYDPKDSSILMVFDLFRGVEVAKWFPESGWANAYEFAPDCETIGLGYPGLGAFRYSLTGDFIDRNKWQDACLTKGDYGTAVLMVDAVIRDAGKRMSPELSAKLISCIDRVLPNIATMDGNWRALALKLRGICLEADGSVQAALVCYDEALALNPKIGIKRRADKLRKVIARPT